MSRQFLTDILKIENSVNSDSSQRCCICLQDYGTLCSETGVIECEIRLPCSHCLGSSCIASWLRSNNTCPVCRRVFFRPDLEHGMEDNESLRRLENLHWLGNWYEFCCALNLSDRANAIALQMLQPLLNLVWLDGHTAKCVGSAAMYIASHLMGEPKSPEDISTAVDIQADHIRSIYRSVYAKRQQLISQRLLEEPTIRVIFPGVFALLLNGAKMEDLLALLPTPTYGSDSIESNTEPVAVTEPEYQVIWQWAHLEGLVNRLCTELGYDRGLIHGFINCFCQDIAQKIRDSMFLVGRSLQTIIAVSIYMASHLLRVGRSIKRISEVVGVSEDTIQAAYRWVYPRRNELVESGFYNRIFILRVRCYLAWPAFT